MKRGFILLVVFVFTRVGFSLSPAYPLCRYTLFTKNKKLKIIYII